MKTCTTLLLIWTLFSALTNADVSKERELQDILRKHADAMGGLRNWNKVESIRTTGTIERDGQLVDFCIIKKRPSQIRATITMPIPGKEEEFIQVIRAHDGKEAWTSTRLAGGDTLAHQLLVGEDAAELVDEAQVLPKLLHLWQGNADLDITGIKTVNGVLHYIISASPKNREHQHYKFLVSADTYHVTALTCYRNGHATSISKFDDLSSQSGIILAKTTYIESPKTGVSKVQINEVMVGVGIYEEYFEPINTSQTALLDQ